MIVCSWCGEVISERGLLVASHGICRACAKKEYEKMEQERQVVEFAENLKCATVVLEPGDGTRYEVTFWRSAIANDRFSVFGVALAEGTGNKAFKLAEHSLDQGYQAIKGLGVRERIEGPIVQWLSGKHDLNVFTAAAVYQAWGVYLDVI